MRARFHRADNLRPPELWAEVLQRASSTPSSRASRSSTTVRLGLALVATILLVVMGIAAFGALLRTPDPDPTPSVLPSTSAAPSPIASPPSDDLSSWQYTGEMVLNRTESHTATLLTDGRVLVTGASIAEVLDPNDLSWSRTGTIVEKRGEHSATLLPDGKVLVAGGGTLDATASAELYDPATGTWTATGQMAHARSGHTAILLQDGTVLVVGGADFIGDGAGESAELYDPTTGTWSEAGNPIEARSGHTATLLADGRVLVAGGGGSGDGIARRASAELFDPNTGLWTATGHLTEARSGHTATLLADGRVLVAGGWGGGPRASAELFDPATGTWTATGSMTEGRNGFTATLLVDGRVFAAGGGMEKIVGGRSVDEGTASAEIYDPITGSWAVTHSMLSPHGWHAACRLADGRVLIVSGAAGPDSPKHPEAEVYQVGPELSGLVVVLD